MNRLLESPLSGIIPPLVTPLLNNDMLDIKGLECLIEHLIDGGVHALFILGTTGEAQCLSYRLRQEMIRETCRITAGRYRYWSVSRIHLLWSSIRLSQIAADYGAEAVVSAPPYYFASAQPELVEFYEQLVEALPLPLFLYNMPTHTKVNFAPQTIRRIAENPKVIGFKDSSANLVYFQSVMYVMSDRHDFSMLVGPEEVTGESVLMGGNGGIKRRCEHVPRIVRENFYNAAKEHNFEELYRIQKIIMQISATIYTIGKYGSSYLKGLKCALSLLGICNDFVAAPFNHFEKVEREQVRKALDSLNMNLDLKP